MKKIALAIIPALIIIFTACSDGKKKETASTDPKVVADSLYQDVITEHDKGMVGWMKIKGRKDRIRQLLDSINTLPAKAQSSLESLKAKLNDAGNALSTAYDEMDVWMTDMNLDSAVNNLELRIKYLTEEKLKGGKITETINNSLQKADSLLKSKL